MSERVLVEEGLWDFIRRRYKKGEAEALLEKLQDRETRDDTLRQLRKNWYASCILDADGPIEDGRAALRLIANKVSSGRV